MLAATLLCGMAADLPRLERASRRASTRARLGLNWAVRFGVALRPPIRLELVVLPWLARAPKLLPSEPWLSLRSLQRQGRSAGVLGVSVWGAGTVGVTRWLSLRVRSREVSARLPRRERASRRASTSSRLGLCTGRAVRVTGVVGTVSWGSRARGERVGVGDAVVATAARTEEGSGGAVLVRVGRASSAERTRPGAEA